VLFFVSFFSVEGDVILMLIGALWPAVGLAAWRIAHWCLKRNILF
jgi:hypothetical protein